MQNSVPPHTLLLWSVWGCMPVLFGIDWAVVCTNGCWPVSIPFDILAPFSFGLSKGYYFEARTLEELEDQIRKVISHVYHSDKVLGNQ